VESRSVKQTTTSWCGCPSFRRCFARYCTRQKKKKSLSPTFTHTRGYYTSTSCHERSTDMSYAPSVQVMVGRDFFSASTPNGLSPRRGSPCPRRASGRLAFISTIHTLAQKLAENILDGQVHTPSTRIRSVSCHCRKKKTPQSVYPILGRQGNH